MHPVALHVNTGTWLVEVEIYLARLASLGGIPKVYLRRTKRQKGLESSLSYKKTNPRRILTYPPIIPSIVGAPPGPRE